MKVSFKVAVAANKLEHLPYTGTAGLYAAVVPLPAYLDPIMDISEELGLSTSLEGLHATVIYSKIAPSSPEVRNFDPTRQLRGLINAIEHWKGHNEKTYIVLKVVSTDIVDQNATFQRMGAEHTFVPFAPHITLSDDTEITPDLQEKINNINRRFAHKPIPVVFGDMFIGDLEP